jgi:hypothetical protein
MERIPTRQRTALAAMTQELAANPTPLYELQPTYHTATVDAMTSTIDQNVSSGEEGYGMSQTIALRRVGN